MTRRQPPQYNWEKLEFDTGLLLPKNFTPRDPGSKIRFIAVHHMIIKNREIAGISANQRCYDTWIKEGREASANYGVDGDFVDQFVWDRNASWANANRWANHNSLTIEHANATFDEPGTHNDYVVDEKTFFNGARLTANAHILFGLTPKYNDTVRKHSNFTSTACPGPYMDRNWRRYFDLMHDIYNDTKHGRALPPPPQAPVRSEPQPAKAPIEKIVEEVIAGVWGNGQDRFNRLSSAGYNAQDIQNRVNALLNGRPFGGNIMAAAQEVIRGVYGNGQERFNRLKAAGFDPHAVQKEVNRILLGR